MPPGSPSGSTSTNTGVERQIGTCIYSTEAIDSHAEMAQNDPIMSHGDRLIRAEQEQRLRQELQEAREALQRAQLEHESACKAGGTLDAGNPDGIYAFQKASNQYRQALERYTIALRDLSDLLLKR